MSEPVFGVSPAPQPYPYVARGSFSGPAAPASVDPLVRYRWPDPGPDDGLEVYLQRPVSVVADTPGSFEGLETLTGDQPAVTVRGTGTIRLDFALESAAWFEMDSADCPGGIRISISEYNRPEYTNVGMKTAPPVRIGDTWRGVFNPELYEGVRFAFIHVDALDAPWHIRGVRLVCQVKPINYVGSFHSSDAILNRIWHQGAYSVKLGNLKDFTTPILVERSDRVQWNGLDFSIMNTANLVVFDARAFVRKQIHATNVAPKINCGIWSFELHDVLSICEYYRLTGDATLVRECMPEALAKLERAAERWERHTEEGTTGFLGWDERLGGFERVTQYNRWAYRLLCIRAWLAWADVAAGLGDGEDAARCRLWANDRIRVLRRDQHWVRNLDVHGCAEAILAGFCTGREIREISGGELADRVNRVSYSQANTGIVVQAMARAGLYDDALVTILDQWGATLSYGGTTTFEMFHPSAAQVLGPNDPPINGQCGMTSLCHPWGAGVCQYLNEVVAGIRPTSPGYATVEILPRLGRRLTAVSATTATPRGPVSASMDTASGLGRLVLPPGVTGSFGVPKVERRIEFITVNGARARGARETADHLVFEGLGSGVYVWEVAYRGVTPAPRGQSLDYPVRCLGEDRATRGDWVGVHGKDGHVLPAYDGVGQDARQLPPYVSDVVLERCARVVWAEGVEDRRAPVRGPGAHRGRNAAAMHTKDPEPTYQTMVVDITADEGRAYTLALYFLDWDNQDRSVGVQIIHPVSLKQLAPVQVVRAYREGAYLLYRCHGSTRVRVDTITPPNATLSGIFFS